MYILYINCNVCNFQIQFNENRVTFKTIYNNNKYKEFI